jgi:hypothetical protein
MNTPRKTGHYLGTPYKTIEEIAIIAAQRVRQGEKPDDVVLDIVDGYDFGHGSANYWHLKEVTQKEAKTMKTSIYIILEDTVDGISTNQVSAADVREAIDQAVKIFGLDVANVLAVIKK